MTSLTDTVTLNNGLKMPIIGLGTYIAKGGDCLEAVKTAIDIGYRHIDTASFYQNEEEVGRGVLAKIKEKVITREDIFVTTKVWNTCHKKKAVVNSCKESLCRLNLGYIDLLLIHWPFAFKEGAEGIPLDENGQIITDDTDYLETWQGMEECVELGLVKSIGVSNFNSYQINRLLGAAKIKPVNNQVECSININQTRLIEFCKQKDITVTAYCPLGAPGRRTAVTTPAPENIFLNPKVLEIAKKYKKTAGQIAIRFVIDQGAIPIPKSVNESRLKENINVFDFKLTDEEMQTLRGCETGFRVAAFDQMKDHRFFPFNIPF